VKAVGQERDEDVGLYAGFLLMEDRPNGEITFEILERFFTIAQGRSR
jgi:hypothetical protein